MNELWIGQYLLTGKVLHQLLVGAAVNGFYQIVGHCFVRAGTLHVGAVHRRAYHIDHNGLGQGGSEFVVFFQEFPAIHDGHVDVEKDHIGQGIGTGRKLLPEIGKSFVSVVKRVDMFGQSGRLKNDPGSILVNIIVIDQADDMFLFHISHGSSNKMLL